MWGKRFCSIGTIILAPSVVAWGVAAEPQTPKGGDALRAMSASFERVAQRVAPSVVQIFVSGYGLSDGQSDVLTKQQGTASGTVLDPDGYIVTNAHVVSRARRIQVLLPALPDRDPNEPSVIRPQGVKRDAEVVGIDTATDLALLKIQAHGLAALQFGDSDKLRQGELVLAFGSPLGLGNTVTMGVVSAVARQLQPDDMLAYVQTDAPINPGNSGGPLVDVRGRVVGINTMIITRSGGSEGVGLAIPSNTVRYIVDQLRAKGRVHRGVIGVQVQTVSPTMAAALGLPQAWGVIVSDIDPDGPAGKAGIQIGDVIVSTDGEVVGNVREFGINLYHHPTGATVALDILRGGAKMSLKVPVVERPEDPDTLMDMVRPEKNLVPQLDILGIDVDAKLAAALPPLRKASGVLVAAMSADASPPADRFQPGDVIHAVNWTTVTSLDELRKAVAGLKDGDPVVVQIERGGALKFVAFEID
ncbi:MAG: PDZ domain-containing protein [Acidobacteria bacterium]|nr:MAG: PDZ domain-containing protein [Acidobacteriota bacterium]